MGESAQQEYSFVIQGSLPCPNGQSNFIHKNSMWADFAFQRESHTKLNTASLFVVQAKDAHI